MYNGFKVVIWRNKPSRKSKLWSNLMGPRYDNILSSKKKMNNI